MSLIAKLPIIIEESREACRSVTAGSFSVTEKIGHGDNILAKGDNLPFMKYLLDQKDMNGKINLIYIDPPFFSKSNYGTELKLHSDKISKIPVIKQKAYHDVWEDGMDEYLQMLTTRFLLMKELLAEDGCLWVHLDWHSVHYIKVILDEIFGEKNFVNEVIWNYKSGGVSSRSFAKKHDTLLYYAGGERHYFNPGKEKSYNRGFKPYRFKGVKEYRDELGWYTMVNRKDVLDVDMVGRTSGERTGYATQKPERLLEILLESCSKPGDLCADFFAGSGTLPAVASRMGRRFLACDNSVLAMAATRKRLTAMDAPYSYYVSSREENGASAEVRADVSLRSNVSEEALCNVCLREYGRDAGTLPVSKADQDKIRTLQNADPLTLVDYWCIDQNYDGINFKTEQWFARERGRLPVEALFLPGPNRCIAVKVYDVFGGFGILVAHL